MPIDSEFASVIDLGWPADAAGSLRQLAGWTPRDPSWEVLEPGRLPLYSCPECGDVYGGALTVAVERTVEGGRELVRWNQLRCEDAHTPPERMPDLTSIKSLTFDASQYDATMRDAAAFLDELAEADLAAEVSYKAEHGRLKRWRKLLQLRG